MVKITKNEKIAQKVMKDNEGYYQAIRDDAERNRTINSIFIGAISGFFLIPSLGLCLTNNNLPVGPEMLALIIITGWIALGRLCYLYLKNKEVKEDEAYIELIKFIDVRKAIRGKFLTAGDYKRINKTMNEWAR